MTGEPTLTSVATNVRVTDCDELIISTVPRTHATDDDSAIDAVGDAVPARVTVVPSILEAKPSPVLFASFSVDHGAPGCVTLTAPFD
jgi:hypothetical protein